MVRITVRKLLLFFMGFGVFIASLSILTFTFQQGESCCHDDADNSNYNNNRLPSLEGEKKGENRSFRFFPGSGQLGRLVENGRPGPRRLSSSGAAPIPPAQTSATTATTTASATFSSTSRGFPPLYQPVLPEGLNCSKVWHRDAKELTRAAEELNAVPSARRPPGFYDAILENCSQYRQANGYVEETSEEEREFPLAFTVLAYKEPEQVERLLRAVYRPHNVYCIHLDLKTKPHVLQQIRALIKCLPNVIESPKRIDVVWGHFSVLEPEIICMEALWRMRTKWKYLINLTGQEFPLKTNKQLVKILQLYRGANDILGHPPNERYKWRWAKTHSPPHNISVAKGPVHVAASRGFVDFLLHSKQARDFLEWTMDTGIPDETYFATINNQYQFKVPGSYTGNLSAKHRIMLNRFKIWDTSTHGCSGKFTRHICQFGLREVATLATSRHFVANKFTYDLQPLAFDCTEQWYFDRVRTEDTTGVVRVDTRYYSNLEIVKHAFRKRERLSPS